MTKIIAEIGWNHGGDISLAKKMIEEAAINGASYAKFQTWSVSRLKNGEWDNDGRREIYKNAELSINDHKELISSCSSNNINFLSSVFSIPDAELLVSLGVKEVKIPSFESRNLELVKFCNSNFETIFMSTGTSTLFEISDTLQYIKDANLYLLHCVSVYPGSYSIANLPKMLKLFLIHNQIGYSDHIEGIESAKIAIGAGAEIVEKHFTIDRNLPGRDNKFAILPHELRELSDFIRNRDAMFLDHGLGYNSLEKDTRENYSGRFNLI